MSFAPQVKVNKRGATIIRRGAKEVSNAIKRQVDLVRVWILRQNPPGIATMNDDVSHLTDSRSNCVKETIFHKASQNLVSIFNY